MSWREVARAARQTGSRRQQILQKALDAAEWAAKQAGGFVGQAAASAAIKKAVLNGQVRHN